MKSVALIASIFHVCAMYDVVIRNDYLKHYITRQQQQQQGNQFWLT